MPSCAIGEPGRPNRLDQHGYSKGEKRPADVIGNAVRVMEIATGQREEEYDTPEAAGKDPAAAALGRKGGMARAEKMMPERQAEIAKKGAAARWKRS
jgi:hypothetical protein